MIGTTIIVIIGIIVVIWTLSIIVSGIINDFKNHNVDLEEIVQIVFVFLLFTGVILAIFGI